MPPEGIRKTALAGKPLREPGQLRFRRNYSRRYLVKEPAGGLPCACPNSLEARSSTANYRLHQPGTNQATLSLEPGGALMKKRVGIVFGTRPDAIKMAPVVFELRKRPGEFIPVVISTGQHRQMLDQVLQVFDVQLRHRTRSHAPQPDVERVDAPNPRRHGHAAGRKPARLPVGAGRHHDRLRGRAGGLL